MSPTFFGKSFPFVESFTSLSGAHRYSVNPYNGLFFFDSSFRPVPLEQHFIAAKGKAGSQTSKDNLDHATFDKALELVKDGHQVLIFVHARKETVKTALMIKEKAIAEGEMEYFNAKDDPNYEQFRRDLGMSRNREMKELVDSGLGIHHAGMLRSDRNISERLFEQNVTKILVCTATLAWGVNLPAYAVIIKGTQLYDSSKGQFMDLSVLDVLQMFGRAGRPQYETHGVSYICTTSDKVDHYITAVSQQVPIESKFVEGLVDSLNAEISLGTVSTVDEGVRWLGYTFLHVRMRKNPLVYGLSSVDIFNDPSLGTRRRELVVNAAKILLRNGMIQYDEDLETLISTELGQIASRYYLRTASVEVFNSLFRPTMTEADLLSLLAKSSEFQQVAVRESEAEELKMLVENIIPCQVKVSRTLLP
jgi:antiviral helicase SLH1